MVSSSGRGMSLAMLAKAVADYLNANPPAGGKPPTDAQINAAVQKFLTDHPATPTDTQVINAVSAYLSANPPAAGAKGDKGDPGAQGVPGETGGKGDKGETGDAGPQGVPGERGQTGARGEMGLKGDTGAKGEKGDPGVQGLQGDSGLRGEIGPKGDKGDTGPRGFTGDTGPKGDVGAQGVKGDTGVQGIQGPKGDTGSQGAKGDTGAQGVKGDMGAKGDNPLVSLGNITIAQNAVVAISAGIRTVTITGVTGLLAGDTVTLVPVAALPVGYAIHNAVATANGTLQVTLSAPLLAIGASYSIVCAVKVLRG